MRKYPLLDYVSWFWIFRYMINITIENTSEGKELREIENRHYRIFFFPFLECQNKIRIIVLFHIYKTNGFQSKWKGMAITKSFLVLCKCIYILLGCSGSSDSKVCSSTSSHVLKCKFTYDTIIVQILVRFLVIITLNKIIPFILIFSSFKTELYFLIRLRNILFEGRVQKDPIKLNSVSWFLVLN